MHHAHTCQEQAAVGGIHLDLCIELAAGVLQPVPLVNDDVLPGQLGQAWPVILAHHEVIAGQQHIKPGLTPGDLHRAANHCTQGCKIGQDPPMLQHEQQQCSRLPDTLCQAVMEGLASLYAGSTYACRTLEPSCRCMVSSSG